MELENSLQRILLIDDDPNDRLLASRELKRELPNIQIREALNWQEIYQAFVEDNFDLVITDYELRWATGLEVLRAVKEHDSERPIVMFTDSGSQEVAVEAMKAGLDDYVLKSPKHLIRLSQAVRSAWEKAQIRNRASELEFRLQFMLNELKVGVFRTTLDGQLIEVSDGLLQLLELNSLAEAQTFFRTKLALNGIEDIVKQRHRQIELTDSGETRWFQISETLVPFGNRSFIDGLVSDISEQKRTAAQLQSLNQTLEQRVDDRTARLEQLNSELSVFAFSVSHDLRSPIRQVNGFVTLLTQELQASTNQTVQHYLQQISRLTDRAGDMIDDLLQFSRTGRAEMHYTSVNMAQLVQEVKRQMAAQVTPRPIHWQIDESLPQVQGDRNLLRQVWIDLISNAVKYTHREEQAEIKISSIAGQGEIIFAIRDNGIGFDTEDAKYLFGVFQRMPNAADFPGTGIGLANVQRVIHRHRGRLWAEGERGTGATFYFALPSASPVK